VPANLLWRGGSDHGWVLSFRMDSAPRCGFRLRHRLSAFRGDCILRQLNLHLQITLSHELLNLQKLGFGDGEIGVNWIDGLDR